MYTLAFNLLKEHDNIDDGDASSNTNFNFFFILRNQPMCYKFPILKLGLFTWTSKW